MELRESDDFWQVVLGLGENTGSVQELINLTENLDFLCIHPFRDGNGRMSRLLSLLLYKNGFDAGKYVFFEEQINNYKTYYYEALRQSLAGWETNENSYFPFIENFLSALYMCYFPKRRSAKSSPM